MPLSLTEFTTLVQTLQGMIAPGTQPMAIVDHKPQQPSGDSALIVAALDRFAGSIDSLHSWLRETVTAAKQEATGEQPAAPKKPRKAAAPAANGAETQPATPLPPMGAPAAAAPAAPAPHPLDIPPNLQRAPATPAAGTTMPPPMGAPATAPAPAPAPGAVSEQQMRDVLRQYMARFATDAGERMQKLLQQFGATQVQGITPDKYAAITAQAQQEMMGL